MKLILKSADCQFNSALLSFKEDYNILQMLISSRNYVLLTLSHAYFIFESCRHLQSLPNSVGWVECNETQCSGRWCYRIGLNNFNARLEILCNTLGYHLHSIGDYQAARPYFERSLEIRKKVLGEEHPDTARSLNNLAVLRYYENDFKEAAGFMRKALAIDIRY